jgi:hypothetical protein
MHPEIVAAMEEPFAYNLYPKYHKIKSWSDKTIHQYCDDLFLFTGWKLAPQFGNRSQLEQVLKKHSGELNFELVIRLTYLCFMPLKDKGGITTIVDKQLKLHNDIVRLSEIFPESKFIFLYRDPLDNLARRKELRKKVGSHKSVLSEAMAWGFIYGRIKKAYQCITSNRVMELKYEDLILNTEAELRRVSYFLNIPYSSVMLNYHASDGYIDNGTVEIGALALSSINSGVKEKPKASKIGEWRKTLSEEEAELIWSICGRTAESIGYEKDPGLNDLNKGYSYYFRVPAMYYNKLIVPAIWKEMPFSLQRLIKKIKYGTGKKKIPEIKNPEGK